MQGAGVASMASSSQPTLEMSVTLSDLHGSHSHISDSEAPEHDFELNNVIVLAAIAVCGMGALCWVVLQAFIYSWQEVVRHKVYSPRGRRCACCLQRCLASQMAWLPKNRFSCTQATQQNQVLLRRKHLGCAAHSPVDVGEIDLACVEATAVAHAADPEPAVKTFAYSPGAFPGSAGTQESWVFTEYLPTPPHPRFGAVGFVRVRAFWTVTSLCSRCLNQAFVARAAQVLWVVPFAYFVCISVGVLCDLARGFYKLHFMDPLTVEDPALSANRVDEVAQYRQALRNAQQLVADNFFEQNDEEILVRAHNHM